MNKDRFAALFGNRRNQNAFRRGDVESRGFTTNPLAEMVTSAQSLMYQAAYQQAQKDLEEPDFPDAECWN